MGRCVRSRPVAWRDELVSIGIEGVGGDDFSDYPAISADGRYAAFVSQRQTWPHDANGRWDVFVRDPGAGSRGGCR